MSNLTIQAEHAPNQSPQFQIVRATFSGRERFVMQRLVEVTPSHDGGCDYYAFKTYDAEAAERLSPGSEWELTLEAKGVDDGKDAPWTLLVTPRPFRVVSRLPGGGHMYVPYFLITLAARSEGP